MPVTLITTSTTAAGTSVTVAANTLTIISAGTTQVSTTTNAVANLATSTNCDVRIDGTVHAQGAGVLLGTDGTSSGHSLLVGQGGLIFGNSGTGATLNGANALLTNHGSIGSLTGNGLQMGGIGAVALNFGLISSEYGFGAVMAGAGAILRNFGDMTSTNGIGLSVAGSTDNLVGRTIALSGSFSADRFINAGTISGSVNLNGGDDRFIGTGGSAVAVLGGTGIDTIRGGDFDGDLNGEQDDDVLSGRAGDDILTGGAGMDVMRGGAGQDEFVFASYNEMGNSLLSDVINGFVSREDKINLGAIPGLTFIGNAAFGSVAGQARYVKAAGQLQFDANGDGVADFFPQLDPGTVLLAGDLIL